MDNLRFTIAPADLPEGDFMAKYGGIYEHSPWVAATLFGAGLGPQDSHLSIFAGRMADIVDAAGHDAQMALLRVHPELAGKLAIAGGLTSESNSEQAGAGLGACSPSEFANFQDFNARYGASFGHPFIIAVRGLTRGDILAAFQTRLCNDAATEFATALAEVHKIARLRLADLC
ncbi:MAG: OHCU decarboxylase [Rhodospirillaceae bacterium]|nr:OHCU decarboxylase [Rhodospirillaceae bacterium]